MTGGLLNSGIAMGGLGTGSVELRGDGLLHDWQIMNNAPWGCGPQADCPQDTAFFGMQVSGEAGNQSVLLAKPPAFALHSITGNSFLNNPYSMPWLQFAEEIQTRPRFPFTELNYRLADIALDVRMEAFSPFIPLDAKNSGLPVAFFRFEIENRSEEPLRIALFQAQRNLTGYAHPREASEMRYLSDANSSRIAMERNDIPEGASDAGTMVLGCWADRASDSSYLLYPRSNRDIWEPLRADGRLEDVDLGAFEGQIGNMGASQKARLREGMPMGVLCRTVEIQAGSSATIVFALAWHFPNFQEQDYPPKECKGQTIGHRYANWFADADEVCDYALANYNDLRYRSLEFMEAYYESSYPQWLLDAAAAQLSVLVKSSWWDREGRFGIWEGLGCCGLQTTDITYYGSFPIVQFFPDIEFSQMRLTRDNVEERGMIPHLMKANFSCCDVDKRGRIDLNPQLILLIWRDVLWTGDLNYAREMWQTVKDAFDYFETLDSDGDGLPNNTGPDQTYDQFPLKGTSAFVGFLYAASLHAAAELADLLQEKEFAQAARNKLAPALKELDRQLWTGQYYRLCHDPITGESNGGVMADQINGDWFLRQTRQAGLLPDDKVRLALSSILEHCSRPEGFIANCDWPGEGRVEIRRQTANQADWPWSGVEYALAAHLISMDMKDEGLKVARDVFERYERAGLRFNHIECGGFYYRALSSWAVYLAMTGFSMDAVAKILRLSLTEENRRFVVCVSTGWATAEYECDQGLRLAVRRGEISLMRIELAGLPFRENCRITLNGEEISARILKIDNGTAIELEKMVVMKKENVLLIGP